LYFAQKYCKFPSEKEPHPIPPVLWGVPFGVDCPCCVSEERRPSYLFVYLLSNLPNIYVHGTWVSRTDGQTDRQTDRKTTYYSNTARCT